MKFRTFQFTYFIFLFLISAGLGFLGSIYYVQHEARFTKSRYSTAAILRTRALYHRLGQAEYQNAHLESQVEELNLKASEFYEDNAYITAQHLAKFVGVLGQEGPGLVITVKDSDKPLLLGDNPNTGIVHNSDLVEIVNELRVAGAKAVSINHQPIVNLTGISCSGPIITINGTRVTSPFVIEGLGNPNQMRKRLDKPKSFLKELQNAGISVEMMPGKVMIPPYSQGLVEDT